MTINNNPSALILMKGARSKPGRGFSTPPVLLSATVSTDGNSVSLLFSKPVGFGLNGSTGFVLSAVTVSYSSGQGTSALVYSTSRSILSTETLTINYTSPGNGVESSDDGTDLNSFGSTLVVNASTYNPSLPRLDSLSSYGQDVGSSGITLTATGANFQNGDQIVVWNTALTTTFVSSTSLTANIPSSYFNTPNFGSAAIRRNSAIQSYALPFESTPTNAVTSNYVQGLTSALQPTYSPGTPGTHPAKLTAIAQATTGISFQRITSITDTAPASNGVTNLRNVYSKWSSVNATGEYLLAEIQDSYTTYLYRIVDGVCLGKVSGTSAGNNSVGENTEFRWSTRGDEPTTVYYMTSSGGGYGGRQLVKKDIVNGGPETLVKDFITPLSMGGTEYLYCDSEGSPSIDMRYWAWMRRDNLFGGSREFVVYDVFTDTIVRAKPQPASGFVSLGHNNSGIVNNEWTTRPNWVSMSPRGDRIQLAWGRSYPGSNEAGFGQNDMPHTYKSSDFSDPIKCAVDETHGAWSWGPNMEQSWTCQNNRIDTMEVTLDVTNPINSWATGRVSVADQGTWTTANAATNGRRQFLALSGSWNNGYNDEPGQHYMWQMSGRKRGFSVIGTDGTYNTNAYGYNNILVIRHSDGRIWRAGSIPHQYLYSTTDDVAKYFSEVQWATDPFGITLHGSSNFQNTSLTSGNNHNEVYIAKLPHNWQSATIWN
jgi:hypothetical protein